MSVQAGIWNFDGKPVDRKLLDDFSQALKQQGPDGEFCHSDGSIALLYRPFHTTAESRREKQPFVSQRGFVITWDGRLDNREELAIELGDEVTGDATDVALFGAAFDRWESECFRRIIGDWAVSIWNPQKRELIFACDFMAIRHIFYSLTNDRVWWSTDLTPLVLLSGDKFHVDDEYIAGYFAHDPEAHLTPYREIRQVPPGQFVRVRKNRCHIERYWKFNPKSRIRYKSDGEYEEHFRHVFRQAVRRRLRSDSPILAELSGGLDSSSIVCMADDIVAKRETQTSRLDTLSYYDATEPDGDDWLYFQKVEQYRGSVGHHIDASKTAGACFIRPRDQFDSLPGSLHFGSDLEIQRAQIIEGGNYRVVLSGIGGDEFLGGIPNPSPQLADLILCGKFIPLARQLTYWSLVKRRPWIHLVFGAGLELLPISVRQHVSKEAKVESWVEERFATKNKITVRLLDTSDHFGFWLPTRRSCIAGLFLIANKMAKWRSPTAHIEEIRCPYLDIELLEFILSIPASQLLRPGERRSLMRRALFKLVPDSILSRTTKQFGARTPIVALEKELSKLKVMFERPLSSVLGYIDPFRFLEELRAAGSGRKIHHVRMFRTISLELWLRSLEERSLLNTCSHLCQPGSASAARPSKVVQPPQNYYSGLHTLLSLLLASDRAP